MLIRNQSITFPVYQNYWTLNLLHFSFIILSIFLLLLNKFSSRKETILDPILQRVKSKWNNHHNEDEFNVWMPIENRKSRDTKVNHLICVSILDKEYGQLRNCDDHKPHEELNVVNPVVNVLV